MPHLSAGFLSYILYIDTLIVTAGEPIIDPKERTYLTTGCRLLEHFYAFGAQTHYLTWTHITKTLVIKIRESRSLACHRICPLLVTYHYRCAAEIVASCDNTVLRENKHRAGTLYLTIHKVDAIDKGLAHINQQCHNLGLIYIIG